MLQPAIINSLRNPSYLPYYPPLMHQTYILRTESDRFEGQHEVQQTTIIIIIIIIVIIIIIIIIYFFINFLMLFIIVISSL